MGQRDGAAGVAAVGTHAGHGGDADGAIGTIELPFVAERKQAVRNDAVRGQFARIVQGIDKHIEDLKYLWTFAPDNRITEHPVRFGTQDGRWTAVTGWLEGTFTRPMVLADGKVIQPTGLKYRIPMATIGRWNAEGIMFEEYLFWDNAEFMKQIGVGG